MFSCSLKNGTTIEYLVFVSLLIGMDCGLRRGRCSAVLSARDANLVIVYQADPPVSDTFSNGFVGEYVQFGLARVLQAGCRLSKIIVDVARVTHQLRGSFRQAVQQ